MLRNNKQFFWETILLSGVALVCVPVLPGQPQELAKAAISAGTSTVDLATELPAPKPKSTVFGGEIHSVDSVQDKLILRSAGMKPMKILFDERTQFYVDGKKMPLRELHPTEHAAIQTALAGTDIFAVSIHVLSQSPEGDYEGRVLNYDSGNGQLTISASRSGEMLKVVVPPNASFARVGQSSFTAGRSGPADLAPGALVSIKFETGKGGQGIANQITILAVPGATFQFNGAISSLDVPGGSMTLVDPSDNKSYQVFFEPRMLPGAQSLHVGSHVQVTATYNGTRYEVSSLATQ